MPQDMLGRIHSSDKNLEGTTGETYHLGLHERIGEATNAAWSRLTTAWRVFKEEIQERIGQGRAGEEEEGRREMHRGRQDSPEVGGRLSDRS